MNRQCGCGGKLYPLNDNPFYFVKVCEACGEKYKQRKRQPKKEVKL